MEILESDKGLLDLIWILIASALVLFMQAGFTCLESGLVRSKNTINVAIKNLSDFCISSAVYWSFGYAIMFGASLWGVMGITGFFLNGIDTGHSLAIFLFQLMFCGTATTIVSGAVAERIRFLSYLIIAILISSLIYPVVGHWAWGGKLNGSGTLGWLAQLGFLDFAGSTVVHSVGGAVALAAIMVIGPRIGRFGYGALKIQGHDLPISVLGVFILWFGWIGFNGGSALAITNQLPLIIVNTVLAAAFGGIATLFFSVILYKRADVTLVMYGTLTGLVSITASCNVVTPLAAVGIGFIAGAIALFGSIALEKYKIDDAVGAVPVHLFGGIWGTLAVALFGDPSLWGTGLSRFEQLQIQSIGILSCFIYSFGVGYLLLYIINKLYPLRVNKKDEELGLNISEHSAGTEVLDLLTEMEEQRLEGNFSRHVTMNPHTEVGKIAMQYNRVIDKVSLEIRKREKTDNHLQEMEATKDSILNSSMDCIITLDHEANITEVNPAAGKLFGMDHDDLIGKPFCTFVFPIFRSKQIKKELKTHVQNNESDFMNDNIEIIIKKVDGTQVPVQLCISPVDRKGIPVFTAYLRDISELKKAEQLAHLAQYDSLTGLANRFLFREHLARAMSHAKRYKRMVGLIFIDLDHFKNINDTLGHFAGDLLLQKVAARLKICTREIDLASRIGGDEFTIILENLNMPADCLPIAKQVLNVMASPFVLDGQEVFITTSIGIATFPDQSEGADDLVKNADTAMYLAKKKGRNNFQMFSKDFSYDLNQVGFKKSNFASFDEKVKKAISKNEFVLYYQPMLDLKTGKINGLEALVRWRHGKKGILLPKEFLPIQEETGIIVDVGEWILKEACTQHMRWQENGLPPIRMSINISRTEFKNKNLMTYVKKLLGETKMNPRYLNLELTESLLMENEDNGDNLLNILNDMGILVSMDDFGTGYSSLNYLKKFPIHILKIDRSFIKNITEVTDKKSLVPTIIELAHNHHLKVVAEGVEVEHQMDFLRTYGCDEAQGHFLAHPMSRDVCTSWLKDKAKDGFLKSVTV